MVIMASRASTKLPRNCKMIGHFSIESHHFQGQFSIISAFSIESSKSSGIYNSKYQHRLPNPRLET